MNSESALGWAGFTGTTLQLYSAFLLFGGDSGRQYNIQELHSKF